MRAVRERFWRVSLLASAALASLVFACAAPLAAIATAAALTMRRRDAVATTAGAWAIAQALGFGVHHYPHTIGSFADGASLGIGASFAACVASLVPLGVSRGSRVRAGLAAFGLAFGAFEIALLPAAAAFGELGAFRLPIVLRVFTNEALWAIAFVLARNVVFARAAQRREVRT
jgi:hypothetical protein